MAYPKNDQELREAIRALSELVKSERFRVATQYIEDHDLMNRTDNRGVLTPDYAILHLVVADAYFQLSKRTNYLVKQNLDIAEDHYKTALFIDKNNKWAQLGYGELQLDRGKNRDAMVTFRMLMLQLRHPKNDDERNENDNIIRKLLANKAFVKEAAKSEIVDLMKLLPIVEQKAMLEDVIQRRGMLGERIWKKEGITECKLGHGMLKEVQKQLDRIAKHQGLDNTGVEMQTRKHQ